MRAIRRLAAGMAVSVLMVSGQVAAAATATAQIQCAQPGTQVKPVPWPQQTLDPESVWPFSTGRGVRVAVFSSGVDAEAPQLRGHVETGGTFVTGDGVGPANTDCAGTGTQVAGVIAAQPSNTVGFHGLAPDATIVPVSVTQGGDEIRDGDFSTARVGTFAKAIRFAVSRRVDVLAIPVVLYQDDSRVRAAIAAALAAHIVVVASAGSADPNAPDRIPYPAAYPGVLGVGAVNADGSPLSGSPIGTFIDVVGPGAQLVSTQRGHGLVPAAGPGIATGFVAAAVALVRARFPQLSPAQVIARLVATATPSPGGPDSRQFGHGMPNPYLAVTERLPVPAARTLPPFTANRRDTAAIERHAELVASRHRSTVYAAVGVLACAVALVALLTIAAGRRRRWRAVIGLRPRDAQEQENPPPPVQLFADR